MTIGHLIGRLAGRAWMVWPDEGRPDGVSFAATHPGTGIYVFVYADGSRSVFDSADGHLAGLGALIPDHVAGDFLESLVLSR